MGAISSKLSSFPRRRKGGMCECSATKVCSSRVQCARSEEKVGGVDEFGERGGCERGICREGVGEEEGGCGSRIGRGGRGECGEASTDGTAWELPCVLTGRMWAQGAFEEEVMDAIESLRGGELLKRVSRFAQQTARSSAVVQVIHAFLRDMYVTLSEVRWLCAREGDMYAS